MIVTLSGLTHTGTLFVQMMELDKGEKYLRKALELHPHHPGALNNLKVIDHYRKNGNI